MRCRIDGDLGVMSFEDALARLTTERDDRTIRQIVKSDFSALEGDDLETNEY